MSQHPYLNYQRQVHLDFHTSPHILDVASEFDADEFAQTMRASHVNSVTVFAKCHHGMSYFPTKVGTQHPALKGRDLLGEQIEALHRAGIRAPIYTTIAWEELVGQQHPEWKMLRRDGSFSRCHFELPGQGNQLGGWWFVNFLHPDYQDYIEAHVREITSNYDVDGFFFDIVVFGSDCCWSDTSVKFRQQHGLLGDDRVTQSRFESMAQMTFSEKFTRIVRGLKPNATIFYNSSNPVHTNKNAGMRARHQYQSHWELESLPSGSWGYYHFPRLARTVSQWNKPWLGMTGRFQRMWGDFGGIKPQAALEYECFRSLALGGANSIGDQLPPRGQLDAGAYDLIRSVYAQCRMAEPFYAGSVGLPQVGIIAPGALELNESETDKSLEGAIQMCDEAHYDCAVLDEASDLQGYEVIILPDSVILPPALKEKLLTYRSSGGKLLLSGSSGFDLNGHNELGLSLRLVGQAERYPNYWRTNDTFSSGLSRSERVIYLRGFNVEKYGNTEALAERVLPYFQRADIKFSSHLQVPPQAEVDHFAAVLAGEGFVYFADPIFREYRQSGNTAARDGWKLAMERLIGKAPFGAGLPSTIMSVPRRRNNDLILTLLHYIPTRKALDIDMIEERSSFAGEELRLTEHVREVIDFETGLPLIPYKGSFVLPAKKGRLLLTVPNFFVPVEHAEGE